MLYLGPYTWRADPLFGTGVWLPPVGAFPVLDLRPVSVQGAAGGPPLGHGIFRSPGPLGAEYLPLGLPADTLRIAQKAEIVSRLGYLSPLDAVTVGDFVWEALTTKADPTGQDNAKPLIPHSDRKLRLNYNGVGRVRSFTFASPEGIAARAALQHDYRASRTASLSGETPPNHYKKVLGGLRLKYGITDNRVFIPSDLPGEGFLPPETTITDDFNRADQAGLGSSSEGWSWTNVAGAFDIVTNAAEVDGTGTHYNARADSDLSSSDHYSQGALSITGSGSRDCGAAVRFSASANTAYLGMWGNSVTLTIYKVVAGSYTLLNSISDTLTNGDTAKFEINGSGLDMKRNTVSKLTQTDTSITGNTRCGIRAFENGGAVCRIDDFVAADLAAGGGTILPQMMHYGSD